MTPELEVVQIGRGEAFTAWNQGYPCRAARWHFHPESGIHYVVATTGRGYLGEFGPGNLVMTGPKLPNTWISHVSPAMPVPLRSRVIQLADTFLAGPPNFPSSGCSAPSST
ncbi:hypothetical protein FHG66_14025 [Rubellimicrobium rubrum]|uniref:AraC-type arabinose-binding/dimerisation domain-containing protein n=1 Tax=Rubellimicrobium rubrum TaxID=2585369 RepID=A0A5C4MVD7_9RHOB|nr:hypothetical protein [Rubellimicrobium rubrum]TNC48466.1 hypothetical protein FHG66_14025 [Rubellimicrobium rubrum]